MRPTLTGLAAGLLLFGGLIILMDAQPPAAPDHVPAVVTVSGFACPNGYGVHLNQDYHYQGHTQDGRPYYRGATGSNRYIYYDARCADDTPTPRWLLGGEPDPMGTSDLNRADSPGCENDFGIVSDARLVPTGTLPTDWLWCGDHGEPGAAITIAAR